MPPDPIGALTYGWRTFLAHAGQIIVAVLVYVAVLIVVELIFAIVVRAAISPSGLFGELFFTALTTGVVVVVISIIQAGIARASLALTDGRSISTNDFFTGDQLGNVIVTALIVGLAAGIGFLLCYIPGVIWLFLVQFAIFFVVDKRLAPVDAIRASIKLVSDNLGVMILFYILSGIVYFVGFCLLCIGLFVAIPVIIIAQAFLFRRLQNEPVAVA